MSASLLLRRVVPLFGLLACASSAHAQAVTDPRVTSWRTTNSVNYARVWETAADKTSDNAVTTWPRAGLTNGNTGGASVSSKTYADVQRVAFSTNYVYIQTTGLASYTMGNWLTPNGATYTAWPINRAAIHRIPRVISIPTTKQKTNGSGGVWVNGVYFWANGDAQSYSTTGGTVSMSGQGIWNRLAGVAEQFNFDTANGHQPSNGAYHNHINPVALRYQLNDNLSYNAMTKTYTESGPTMHSPILGWANDGLPVYGPYGYSSAMSSASGVRRMTSGFVKRNSTNQSLYGTDDLAVTGRVKLPVWAASVQGKSQTLAASEYGPSTTTMYNVGGGVMATYSVGVFAEDYEYLGDLGKTQGVDFDLNRQNVRFCVTPEFPSGTWAYFVCIDASGATQFPDVINQEYYATAPMPSMGAQMGTVTSITEAVTEYADAGPAAPITLSGSAVGGDVSLQWNSAEGATYTLESSANGTAWTTLSASLTSAGTSTTYTAPTAIFYRVTLSAIASYDTSGTFGTAVGTTKTLQYGTVPVAPSIITHPSNVLVNGGSSASFTVVANGTATLSYQWQKGTMDIGGATSGTYTIMSTVTGDAGSYRCVVTNSVGSATSNAATLTVNSLTPPNITTPPASATVTQGGSASFAVAASGAAPMTYIWFKDGVEIVGATSATYTISSVQPGDAGNYSVQVTNSLGSAASAAAALTVNVTTTPLIVTPPASVSVLTGTSASFTVSAVGTALLSYQWRKNGANIAGATSATYSIASVTANDAGSYTCVVSNSVGSTTSDVATLSIGTPQIPPTIALQPANATSTVGSTAIFSITASGSTPLSYQWKKDGTAISGATQSLYSITNVQTGHAGTYTCVVTNIYGTVTSNAATLTVATLSNPAVSNGTTSPAVSSGGTATLSVTASGFGPFAYTWSKNGVTVSNATSSSLAISNVQPANAGIYRAAINNASGTTNSDPFIIGVTTTEKVIGTGSEVGPNIVHANGNVYDQVLLDGAAATVTADAGQVLRISFLDLTDDIVQVEFSGAGTLTLTLDNATGPVPAVKYNQPGVTYMKGQAGITLVGANETTNLSIFSVGRITAVNQSLFRSEQVYDGIADVGFVAISTTNGKFGGLRAANTSFSQTRGVTGIYAPGVAFSGPVYLNDISGYDSALAMLILGSASDVKITGGDLLQANLQAVQVKGIAQLRFADGVTSQGAPLPARQNSGRLLQDGVDVTTQIVVNPPVP